MRNSGRGVEPLKAEVEGCLDVWVFRSVPSVRADARAFADAFAHIGDRGARSVGVVVQVSHRDL